VRIPNLLDRETRHREFKPLKKHESVPYQLRSGRVCGAIRAIFGFKTSLIMLHIFAGHGVVYQPLTLFGKDCARIG
jgi:hypothetical protein